LQHTNSYVFVITYGAGHPPNKNSSWVTPTKPAASSFRKNVINEPRSILQNLW
jgi:hypothetical protein